MGVHESIKPESWQQIAWLFLVRPQRQQFLTPGSPGNRSHPYIACRADDLIQCRYHGILVIRGEFMLTLHPEYVVDEHQRRKAVLLPLAEWDRILEDLEDLDDIRAFDTAKSGSQEIIPFDQAVCEIQGRQGE
jgi:hypothetical protein